MADSQIHVTRLCTKCGVEKPATPEFFGKAKLGLHGLRAQCKPCCRAYNRVWQSYDYAKNPERYLKRCQDYRDRHAEEYRRRQRERVRPDRKSYMEEYHRSRRDEEKRVREEAERNRKPTEEERSAARKAYQRLYYALNKNKYASRSKMWREQNGDRARELARDRRAKDPARHREYWHRYRGLKNAARGEFSSSDLHVLMDRQNGLCFYCFQSLTVITVDHFIPLSRGGSNEPKNLRLACKSCNSSKSNKLPWVWKPDRFSPPETGGKSWQILYAVKRHSKQERRTTRSCST